MPFCPSANVDAIVHAALHRLQRIFMSYGSRGSMMAHYRPQILIWLLSTFISTPSNASGQSTHRSPVYVQPDRLAGDSGDEVVERGIFDADFRLRTSVSEEYNAIEQVAAWTDHMPNSPDVDSRTGFLGKKILRGDYWTLGVDDPTIALLDDTLNGYRVSFNYPLPWLTRQTRGVDLLTEYESLSLSGADARGKLELDVQYLTLGVRAYSELFGCIRPFATLGAQELKFDTAVYDSTGFLRASVKDSDWFFYSSAGVEVDLSETIGLRFEAELPEEVEDGFFESTMLFWSQDKSFFCRGGLQVPFEDELGVGLVAGAGVSF